MQQHTGPSLPCLDALNAILTPDKDTNFLSNLIPQSSIRASITIDLAKSLYDRLEKQEILFKSSREVDWALEILGYGFIPPHSQFIKDERNHLKNIITIYDFLLSDEAEITVDAGTIKISSRKPPVLNLSDYHHQKICLKMLSHLTLIFDKRNFEKKPNPLVGDPRLREEEMKVPIKLCAMVIRIYDKFLNKAYPFLYPDNWEYIIKLISGLASFILQGSIENKFPERIHVAVVELLYNSWIFSGLQNEQTWLVFKQCIHDIITKDTANSKQNAHELTAKDIIVSYWTDICAELTAKLLIDLKCYEPPKLLLSSKDEKIEYNYNLLIINHNYNLLKTDVQQQKKKFTLFQQPFLFNISQEQVQYLWGKMITMMPDTLGHARTYYLVIQGIRNIVNLLLRLGTLSKPTEEIQESSAYRIENKRIIKIDKSDHEYIYFKKLLNYITSKEKIKPNDKRISTNNSQASKAAPSEEEKLLVSKKKSKNLDNAPSQILKRPQDDQHRLINTEKEYSWVVKTEKVPSGEYLLKLFGRVLFEGAAMTVTGYEDARLLAINILCKIFTKACGPFPEAAVKRFYKVYLEYLESELNLQKLQTFFKHSTELFLVNHLPHNIVLQVPLVNKLVEYYTNHKESGFQDKILRGACNKICSSLLCFFNDENGLINSKYNYVKNVKDILNDLLEVAFQKDKEAIVSHRLASTKSSHEEAKILARSAWNFMIYSIMNCKINGFVSKITDGWFERSFPLLNNLGIDIFLVLGEICLMRDDYQSPSPLTVDVASAGFSIIEKIKKFIEHRTKDLNDIIKHSSQKNNEKDEAIKQISSSFGILYTWLLVLIHLKGIENLDQKKEFSPAVEGTIKLLISYQNYEPFAISVKCMLASLLNRLGNASFSSNSPFASSILLNENSKKYATLDEMTDKLEEKCLLSIAIGEDTILSFYDLQIQSTNEAIVFMVRNTVGRFVWFGELFYKLFCPSKKGLEESLQEAAIKIPAFKEEEKKQRNMSFEIMNPTGTTNNQELELLLQQQFEIEDQYEETHTRNSLLRNRDRFASEASLSLLNETEEDKITRSKINTIKMFLSSTGILSIKDLEKITYIPSGGSIRDLLKKIDSSPARCQILSSIFYVLSPSSEKLSEFPRTDKLFQNFIEDLGVTVDEDTIESGAHESIRTLVNQHKKVIFASNPLYEMIFTLPNLLQAQMNLQEFSSTPPIIIVWNAKLVNPNESFYPYIINRLDIKGFKTALIITPLNEGYFSLNILKRDSDFMSFPPIKDFVCSYHMLVTLVPQMVISIYREYQNCHHKLLYHEVITGKIQDRQKHISNLITFSKKEDHQDHQWELLKSFFDISKS